MPPTKQRSKQKYVVDKDAFKYAKELVQRLDKETNEQLENRLRFAVFMNTLNGKRPRLKRIRFVMTGPAFRLFIMKLGREIDHRMLEALMRALRGEDFKEDEGFHTFWDGISDFICKNDTVDWDFCRWFRRHGKAVTILLELANLIAKLAKVVNMEITTEAAVSLAILGIRKGPHVLCDCPVPPENEPEPDDDEDDRFEDLLSMLKKR